MTMTTSDKIDFRRQVCDLLYQAEADDVEVFFDALKRRSKTIREQRADTIVVGANVRTVNLSPKALSGLTGTVTAIQGKRATIEVDERSLPLLRRTRYAYAAPTLTGIPLTALEIQ